MKYTIGRLKIIGDFLVIRRWNSENGMDKGEYAYFSISANEYDAPLIYFYKYNISWRNWMAMCGEDL